MRRRPVILIALCLFTLLLGVIADRILDRQHLPWRSLDPDARVGFATDLQLFRVSLSPSSVCKSLADNAASFMSTDASAHRPVDPCGWDKARNVHGGHNVSFSPQKATMQCPLALGTYIWIQEIDAAAQEHLGSGLSSIQHAGAYSCRRQVGNNSGAWSEHAFANAWDIMGFELKDGRVISVLKDWDGDKDRRKFLRDVRGSACKIFRVTLSPDFNAAHKDHFHVDMGPTISCR